MIQCRRSLLRSCLLSALVLLVSCSGPQTIERPPASVEKPGPPGFSLAVRRALPLTVGVYGVAAPAPDALDRTGEAHSVGAGFFIDGEGTIATAAHVVTGAGRIVVKLTDQRVFEAKLIGADDESDIALIRVPVEFAVAPGMGRSASLQSGDWVVAIGEPYGLHQSVAAGVVGGGARHFSDDRDALFIQSDLALNPGNSGGPLIDASGSIVGMNLRMMVGVAGTAGVSLSMPIELVLRIAADIRDGSVGSRPRLGAKFEDVSPAAALAAGRVLADGVVIFEVEAQGIAQRAGLREDDIVVGFNGRPIADSVDMVKALFEWEAARGTRLTVHRDGAFLEVGLD